MSVEEVTQIVGHEANIKHDGAWRDDLVLPNVADDCLCTLVYTQPFSFDAIYCYFDAEDKLIAGHLMSD